MLHKRIENGWSNFRKSLGFNLKEMTAYLELNSMVSYRSYEQGNSVPLMHTFVAISDLVKSKGRDIRYTIYPQYCYQQDESIPIIRDSTEWVVVDSLLGFRKELNIERVNFVKVLNSKSGRYAIDIDDLYRWESGSANIRTESALRLDQVAIANKIELLPATWDKCQNRRIFTDVEWAEKNKGFMKFRSGRKMKGISKPFCKKVETTPGMEATLNLECYEPADGEEPTCPVDLLRERFGMTRKAFGELFDLRTKGIGQILLGKLFPSVPLAKAMQEEARRRGIAITLDEIYQNVVPWDSGS